MIEFQNFNVRDKNGRWHSKHRSNVLVHYTVPVQSSLGNGSQIIEHSHQNLLLYLYVTLWNNDVCFITACFQIPLISFLKTIILCIFIIIIKFSAIILHSFDYIILTFIGSLQNLLCFHFRKIKPMRSKKDMLWECIMITF